MRITRLLLIITPVVWLLWDIVAYHFGGNAATESANIFVYATAYPWISLYWGYLTGHFFAQKRLPSVQAIGQPFWKTPGALIALLVPVPWAIWDLFHYPSPITGLVMLIPGPGHGTIEMVFLGIVIAYFVFQMNDQTIEPEDA